jgi:hypothetical protein
MPAGAEMFSPFNIGKYYSNNEANATAVASPQAPAGTGGATPSAAASFASATGTMEGYAGRRVAIQTLRQIVEARTRKLSARWTFESAQDAQAQQGIDIEEELMAALAQEITAEIDQEILYHLGQLRCHQRCWCSDLRCRPT